VKERQEWWAGYGVQTDIRCGSELLIYVRPKSTDSRELWVIRRSVSATYRRGSKITVAALNQAVNGTHAFRGAGGLHHQLQSRSGGHLRPQLLQLDSGRAEPMVRPHQPPCGVGERRDMCCTASQVDTQRKVVLVHEPAS
jgi:hypothetical protein